MSIRNSIILRVRVAFLFIVIIAAAIVVKIVDIQFVNGERWIKAAEERGLKFRKVAATRGDILSDNGSLLATSIPFYRLAIDPVVATDSVFNNGIDSLSLLLSKTFRNYSASQFDSIITQSRRAKRRYKVLSSEYITYQQKKKMEKWPIFREGRIKGGVLFEKMEKRFKPFDDMSRRTIGFIRQENDVTTGRGLEISYNEKLSGKDGQALFQRISGGRWKPINDEVQVRAENGLDVQTTLNVEFQEYAEEVMQKALKKHKANYGSAILMEVATGEIKAIVNLGKSPKNENEYIEDFNYAVQGVVEPGSTFKLASMMALLDETDISVLDSVSTGDGKYMFYEECIMTDANMYGYGMLSVAEVFEKSSNIGISKLIFQHFREDPDKFIRYLDKFHLTEPFGFQMSGEGEPFVGRPGDANWSGCSLPWMSIGYELKMSPLQMLAFYNGVANQGKMVTPIIVSSIKKGNKEEESFEADVLNKKLCSTRSLELIQDMLQGVVERGTARNIKDERYKIAGKTGTTQKVKDGKYTKNYYTSFVGYFPADNPKYSCIVVIDEPEGDERYGGQICAPVFKDIADMVYLRTMTQNIRNTEYANQSLPYIKAGNYQDLQLLTEAFDLTQFSKNTSNWVRTSVQGDTIQWEDNFVGTGRVPDVRGMTLRDALYLLELQGLEVRHVGNGRVQRQSLSPGTQIRRGNRIFIRLE